MQLLAIESTPLQCLLCLYRVGVLDVKPLASGLYSNFHDSEWTGFVLIKTSCLEKVVSGLFWWVSLFYCRLPLKQQRDYKNVFDAMFRITREEGILTLWRVSTLASVMAQLFTVTTLQGCTPTVMRAMVVNAAQLATYSQAKQFLLSTGIGPAHWL